MADQPRNKKADLPLILIVDDKQKNLQVLGALLEDKGYEIALATSGRQALDLVNDIHPDLILLDIIMPGLNGFDICKTLKASAHTKDIPVIFLSAITETDDIIRGFDLGAADYVTKPFNATELLSRVHTHLTLKKARDDQNKAIIELQEALSQVRQLSDYLTGLFESIPCGVLVINTDRRVRAVNHVLERTFGVSKASGNKLAGEVLKCVNALESEDSCGTHDPCQFCQVRNVAIKALEGNQIHQQKANIDLLIDGKETPHLFLISAAPFDYNGERLAVIILEDITELNGLRRRIKAEQSFSGIVGRDEKIQELFETIRELAESNVSVLVEGESGTGKELVASAIHNEGPRVEKQFVPVNCGALPDGLLESELFGHVKGAFTGAIRDKKGRFQVADGGTIFLDEIGDLSAAMQVKLLRVLQEGTFEPVGGEKTIQVDVRVISATNKDLKREIAGRRFREDLFYRICVVPIKLPPLRQRLTDISLLADYFLEKIAKESGREKAALSDEALSMLIDYRWPGNVRELQNSLQFALIKAKGKVIRPEHLPPTITSGSRVPEQKSTRRKKLDQEAVNQALRETGGNKVKAAKRLGVSRATLYRFIEDQGN